MWPNDKCRILISAQHVEPHEKQATNRQTSKPCFPVRGWGRRVQKMNRVNMLLNEETWWKNHDNRRRISFWVAWHCQKTIQLIKIHLWLPCSWLAIWRGSVNRNKGPVKDSLQKVPFLMLIFLGGKRIPRQVYRFNISIGNYISSRINEDEGRQKKRRRQRGCVE